MSPKLRGAARERRVQVPAAGSALEGDLVIPTGAQAVVLFAHGSGSSRHSPRNRCVAQALQEKGLATLLLDLLTAREEAVDARTAHLRFDIGLLAERLVAAIEWLGKDPETADLTVGCFGASTGAAAALVAAAHHYRVRAVVSRGGRPDLAGDDLTRVRVPTLLIVGGDDHLVLRLNETALAQLGAAEKRLEVIPGASHLFEEPGALPAVARLAADWFTRHLAAQAGRPAEHAQGRG
jgi:putative phosphoribosyl transferase